MAVVVLLAERRIPKQTRVPDTLAVKGRY